MFPPDGDQSLGPVQDGVLRRGIEYTNNATIGVGNLDYILPTNGTLLALQNLSYPRDRELLVTYDRETNQGSLAASGVVGRWGHERGLTFYQVDYAGHQQTQFFDWVRPKCDHFPTCTNKKMPSLPAYSEYLSTCFCNIYHRQWCDWTIFNWFLTVALPGLGEVQLRNAARLTKRRANRKRSF